MNKNTLRNLLPELSSKYQMIFFFLYSTDLPTFRKNIDYNTHFFFLAFSLDPVYILILLSS